MKKKTSLKPDPVLKDFWSNNDRFADLFNQVFFQGETAVLIEQERITAVSRDRDIIKQHTDSAELVLIALENRNKITIRIVF